MKARIFSITVLMIVALATNAQNSRRGERTNEKSTQTQEVKNNERKTENTKVENNNRRTQTPTERQPEKKREERQTQTQPAERPLNPNSEEKRRETNVNDNKREPSRNVNENKREPSRNVNNTEQKRQPSNTAVNTNRPSTGNRSGEVRHSSRGNREYVYIDRSPRKVVVHHPKHYTPRSVEYRRVHNPYRAPVRNHIIWSINLHNDFRIFYPEVRYWRYETGYRLPSVPAYDAYSYIGDVAHIYGRVFDSYYDYNTDDYYLYFGDYYPYHDFSIILSGNEARRLSRRPERFFQKRHIAVTGYITEFDNKPEILVRRASQLDLY